MSRLPVTASLGARPVARLACGAQETARLVVVAVCAWWWGWCDWWACVKGRGGGGVPERRL